METIPVEISTTARRLEKCEDLVLHVDVQKFPDGPHTYYSYSSALYETTPDQLESLYPVPPPASYKILFYSGTRLEELQATLSLIDLLLRRSYAQGYRKAVERWILECEDRKRRGFRICLKVRHKGRDAYPRELTAWLVRQWRNGDTAPELVSQAAITALRDFNPSIEV
jgi:hypothetical protein